MLLRFGKASSLQGVVFGAALLCVATFQSACATTPLGATDAQLAKARAATPTGAEVYAAQCARCHGDRGQGKSAPQLIGVGGLPKFPRASSDRTQQFTDPQEIDQQVHTRPPGTPTREAFNNAGDVFNYVSKNMPKGDLAGTLKPEEYWAVVTFILTAHGVQLPPEGVTPQNAESIGLEPQ